MPSSHPILSIHSISQSWCSNKLSLGPSQGGNSFGIGRGCCFFGMVSGQKQWPSDCTAINETQATELFNKWNKEAVMQALDPILETYRPLIWARGNALSP